MKDRGSGCLGNTAGLGTRGVVVWITLLGEGPGNVFVWIALIGEGPGVWLYG